MELERVVALARHLHAELSAENMDELCKYLKKDFTDHYRESQGFFIDPIERYASQVNKAIGYPLLKGYANPIGEKGERIQEELRLSLYQLHHLRTGKNAPPYRVFEWQAQEFFSDLANLKHGKYDSREALAAAMQKSNRAIIRLASGYAEPVIIIPVRETEK